MTLKVIPILIVLVLFSACDQIGQVPQYNGVSPTSNVGTAAFKNVGTNAGNMVQLDDSARLPAVDGSKLTNVDAATVGGVSALRVVTRDSSGNMNGNASSANFSHGQIGTTVASAARVPLDFSTGDFFTITGTTGIAGFPPGPT